jgi:hypothetical protein
VPGAPPPSVAPGAAQPVHPAATASLVFGIIGFGLIVVGGMVAAVLGVVARRAIAAEPDHWRGTERATTGIVLGLMTSAVPLGVLAASVLDDHGAGPLVAVLVYVAVVCGAAASAGRRTSGATKAGRAGAGAAAGVSGIVIVTVVLVGITVAIGFMFDTIFRTIGDAIGDAACGGS